MNKVARLNPKKTALLVIDVQKALFTRPDPIFKAYQMIEVINALVDRAHLYGLPVIYIQHANQSILAEGSDGWKLHPGVSPAASDLSIRKTQGNSFLGTTLQGDLEARGVENVIVTGLVTHQCIRSTCLGGVKLGYNVFLVQGGHSNYSKNPEAMIEQREEELENAGVYIVTPEQIDLN